MAEAVAFGSLLTSGTPVRLSGQDSQRGTFNQRHSVLIDIENETEIYSAESSRAGAGAASMFTTRSCRRPGVLGFEYGFSRDYSRGAGDVGGAVWRLRQRRADHHRPVHLSGEDKWGLLSGLVLLLPHGYEGQGPEHSSARMERLSAAGGA